MRSNFDSCHLGRSEKVEARKLLDGVNYLDCPLIFFAALVVNVSWFSNSGEIAVVRQISQLDVFDQSGWRPRVWQNSRLHRRVCHRVHALCFARNVRFRLFTFRAQKMVRLRARPGGGPL
jgi:hypothetical protein